MNNRRFRAVPGVCAVVMAALWAAPAGAQTPEVKEKAPLYSYVGNWAIPRAQWGEMAKAATANQAILDKAVADGTIVGYGSDETLMHQPEGATHDSWWSAMSMAGVLNVLEQFHKAGTSTSPVLASATKHWDSLYVSRYYNWHPGTWKDVYTRVSSYRLKPDAPNDARGDAEQVADRAADGKTAGGRHAPPSTKSTRRRCTPARPVDSGSSTSRPTRPAWTRSTRRSARP